MISLLHATRGTPERALATRKIWIDRADEEWQVEHILESKATTWKASRRSQRRTLTGGALPHLQRGPRQAWQTGMFALSFPREISWW